MPSTTQILAVSCVLAFLVSEGRATITHRRISPDARDHYRVELPFGFDKGGVIELKVTDLVAYTQTEGARVDLSQSGFFLAASRWETQIVNDWLSGKCYLEDESLFKLMDFSQWTSDVKNISSVTRFEKEDRLVPGEYSLYYANCNETVRVSCHVRVAMYNEDADGDRDYLSIGYRPLPSIYMLMFLVFSVLAMTWAKACFADRRRVHGIHYLMLSLVVLRSVVCFTMAGMYHEDRVTGSPDGWNVAYYVFTFLKGVMFFVVIVLIGSGWPYLGCYNGKTTMTVLSVVIPLQVFVNVSIIILDESSPAWTTFITLTDLLHLVDIICCCAILVPIFRSIKHLKKGAATDAEAAVNVEKLKLFRQFCVLVVVYIYFTRIIVYLLENTLPYQRKWMSKLASELATVALYVAVGTLFQPHGEKEYQKLCREEQEGDKPMEKGHFSPAPLAFLPGSPERDEV